MTHAPQNFAALIAPLSEDAFFADYFRQKPLHIRGGDTKLSAVMSWEILSRLLGQTGIWTQRSLELAHELKKLPASAYCRQGTDRDMRDNMLADMDRVMHWMKQGASLVCNDIASLTPELQQVATILEEAIGGKAQANLYCSWQAHPAFGTHFDTHDVFALHVAGQKRWKIYQCPHSDPVTHPVFKSLTPEYHQKNCGPVSMDVTLEPGDVLYIPRGWYHDALAESEGTIHVAFGVTPAIGLDMISHLFERAVHEADFRAAVPREDNPTALAAHLVKLGERLGELTRDPAFVKNFASFVASYRYHRRQVDLPAEAIRKNFQVTSADFKVIPAPQGGWALADARQAVPLPTGLETYVRWIIDHPSFTPEDLVQAFPDLSPQTRSELLRDLARMKVIRAA